MLTLVFFPIVSGVFSPSKVAIDSTFIWNLNEERAILPVIHGGNPMLDNTIENTMPRDKHWSAIVNHTKLYFVYNMDPLRVMDCQLGSSALCKFIHKEGMYSTVFTKAKHLKVAEFNRLIIQSFWQKLILQLPDLFRLSD